MDKIIKLFVITIVFVLVSCNNKSDNKTIINSDSLNNAGRCRLESLHDKYRTLWYRSNFQCYGDSCHKYGLLVDSCYGIKETNFNMVDTIPVNEPSNCN